VITLHRELEDTKRRLVRRPQRTLDRGKHPQRSKRRQHAPPPQRDMHRPPRPMPRPRPMRGTRARRHQPPTSTIPRPTPPPPRSELQLDLPHASVVGAPLTPVAPQPAASPVVGEGSLPNQERGAGWPMRPPGARLIEQ
jgi:hypothetical protein